MKINRISGLVLGVLVFALSFAQAPSASFTSSGHCVDQVVSFSDASTTPAGTITKWHWDFGVNALSDDTSNLQNPEYIFTTSGTYQVKLIIWNSAGDVDSSFEFLSIFPTPEAEIQANVPCFPAAVEFTDISTVSSGFIQSRFWRIETNTSTSGSFNYNFSAAGSYNVFLSVNTNDGCVDTVTTKLFQGSKPVLSFTPNTLELCEDDTLSLSVSGANNYLWDNDSTSESIEIYSGGFVGVTGYNGNFCFSKDSISAILLVAPNADAGDDVTINLGESTTLDGSGDGSYSWMPPEDLSDPSVSNPIATPKITTNYILTVIAVNGCFANDTVLVSVEANSNFPVHNFITPNNDGSNDVWDLSAIPNIAKVSVFNRWGWEVYKSDSYQNDWNGTHNDDDLPDGTYVYVITFMDNTREPLAGTLEILRNTIK